MFEKFKEITSNIKQLIASGGPENDRKFGEWMVRLFQAMGEKVSAPFRDGVWDLSTLPMVTEQDFKTRMVAAFDLKPQMAFKTSGTTQKHRGIRYVFDYGIYELSVRKGFLWAYPHLAPNTVFVSLVPSAGIRPDSSLSHMADIIGKSLFSKTVFLRENPAHIDHNGLFEVLNEDQPVFIFATQADLTAVVMHMRSQHRSVNLPPGSLVMFTGGSKGTAEAFTLEQLIENTSHLLNIPRENITREFGMTELFSQSYDVPALPDATDTDRCFRPVPWLRSLVIDPVSLREAEVGQTGMLVHLDLANCLTHPVLLSSDLVRRTPKGFQYIARISGSTPRGCSQDGGV